MKDNRQWPDDYQNWTGTIDDLVREAGVVLRQISPEIEVPTLSGVRYYQNKGALGRGQKRGRVATFGFDDLATVVATKQMVNQQLPLALTRDMLSNTSVDTMMKSAGLEEYASYASPAVAATMALTHSDQQGNAAEQTVAKLLAASNLPGGYASNSILRSQIGGAQAFQTQTMLAAAIPSIAPVAVKPSLPPGGVLRYALQSGVAVEIPADAHNRAAQAQALRAFADQLDPPPHTTWSTT